MAYPPAYVRAYSFTDFETLNPGEPKPGDKLDTEYDAVSNALTATQTNLALIQRADGELANESVGVDQLQAGLFDAIGDAAVADAEAAAAAAAASASAAAGSASSASSSASAASASAATASGAAAQAGVSQGIAQSAANDAALSATTADTFADVAVQAANDTAGSVAATEAAVQRAFEWAELLTGPVLPAPPGWPEAVDDGMFSSKWWAIRARDYNATQTIDLGTAGADIGEAFDIWDAIPGNDLGVGQTYATWGTPTQTYVLIDRSNPSDPASWQNITGGPGPPGPANTLTVGTVTTGAPGSAAIVTITGTAPNQVLNMTIPRGDTGATGPAGVAGPPNALAIGTVTTGAPGSPAAASITGTAPTQTLNLTIPEGQQGIQGIQGIQGPVGPAGTPVLANPTAVIGLAVVNGVATSALRSDSAPALSQGIAPTWTGAHYFAGGTQALTTIGVNPGIRAGLPAITFALPSIAAGSRAWELIGTGTAFGLRSMDDAFTTAKDFLLATKAGNVITNVAFGNATDNPTYTFFGSGLTTMGGQLQVNGDHVGVASTDSYYELRETDVPLDEKVWWMRAASSQFAIQLRGDSGSAGTDLLRATRTAANVAQVFFGSATSNPTYNFLGTGALVFSGVPTFGGFGPWDGENIRLISIKPGIYWQDTNAGADLGIWFDGINGIARVFSVATDAGQYRNWLAITRSGGAVTELQFGNAVNNPIYSFFGTGNANFGGPGIFAGTVTATILYANNGGISTKLQSFVGGSTGIVGTESNHPLAIYTNNTIRASYAADGSGFFPSVQIRHQNGTAAAPSYSWSGEGSMGFFRDVAGATSFASSSTKVLMFSLQGIENKDGTTSQPSYAFSGEVGTGHYRAGAGIIGFSSSTFQSATLRRGVFAIYGTAAGVANNSYVELRDSASTLVGYMGDLGASENNVAIVAVIAGANVTLTAGAGGIVNMTSAAQAPSFTSTSSRAIKRVTGAPRRAADLLARLRPLLYRLLDGDDHEQLGLIAEEVHEVCPQLSDGKSVAYDRLAILLLAAWQDEHAEAA